MGDLRAVYDGLVTDLVGRGFRVIVLDVRGHGDSDAGFADFGDDVTAADVLALLESVGRPAVLVGNSFAGSAAVLAAADRPDLVRGLVLLSPFLRDRSSAAKRAVQRLLFAALLARPWGARFWTRYYAEQLNRGRRPADLDARVAEITAVLRHPERLRALRRLAVQLDHTIVEPRLGAVRAPALIAVGALDPDYADPAAELDWMGRALSAETLLIPEAAHYAHAQRPDLVLPALATFLDGLRDGDDWSARA
jgi:pimeloyl-ACP methyl ester carboxylesterase